MWWYIRVGVNLLNLLKKNDFWLKNIQGLKPVLADIEPDPSWGSAGMISETLDHVQKTFVKDMQSLEKEALFMFSSTVESDNLTEQSAAILRKWQVTGAPSLTALSVFALQQFEIDAPQDFIQAILVASILGEVENDLSYHNNMHYRKVLFNVIRMIAVHNFIYEGTARSFDVKQICLFLMGACAHDLGHDGRGNTIKGVFYQGRLEKLSYDLALPYFKAVGFEDEKALADFRVMVLCTEVTPLDDPGNPMNQMKAAYRFHYLGDASKTHSLNLDPDIAELEVNPHLTTMCLILHEADIATSAGVTYDVTKYETSIYMQEIGTKQARPQHVIDFLNQICQRKFLSDAGQRLFAGNLARIYALAQADVEAGDEIYPAPEHSDFILTFAQEGQSSKTLN